MPTLQITNPQSDISELLFAAQDTCKTRTVSFGSASNDSPNNSYYVGPIEVTSSNVQHGLGVVATREIEQGECLFVTKAAVSANVSQVHEEWKTKSQDDIETSSSQTLLEHLAEQALIRAMRRTMESKDAWAAAQSFLLQLTGADRTVDVPATTKELMAALVGDTKSPPPSSFPPNVEDQQLLEIIRKNAFGPDFVSYEKMEQKWKASPSPNLPSRLLGLYPLAAMINHSCVPNALRVFASDGEYMIVHASTNIKKGEEIAWSYLPPIQPYPIRRQQLQDHHGFVCACPRCRNEQLAAESSPSIYEVPAALQAFETNQTASRQQFTKDLVDWEKQNFAASKQISNETKRYWKMGNANLYIYNLNVQLMDMAPALAQQIRNHVLMQAMELHFCFVSCHYACTEHLSVMHLCYELVAVMHSQSTDPSKTMPKVRFWTEQLKRAHLVRYGAMGNDVNRVRAIMKHTQMVLRHQNGLEKVPYEFI